MKTTHKSLQMSQYTQIYQSCKSNQLNVTLFFKTLRTFVEAIIQVLRIQPDVVSLFTIDLINMITVSLLISKYYQDCCVFLIDINYEWFKYD